MQPTRLTKYEERARTVWRRFCRELDVPTETGTAEHANIGLNFFDAKAGVFEVEIDYQTDPEHDPSFFKGIVEGSGLATYENTFKAEPTEHDPTTLYVVQFRIN